MKKWENMSRQERRLAIAKDVLASISRKNVKVTQGEYFNEVNGKEKPNFGCDIKAKHKCEVCAKGGLLLSFMRLAKYVPEVPVIDVNQGWADTWIATDHAGNWQRVIDNDLIIANLKDTFSQKELDQIEQVFEGWNPTGTPSDNYSTLSSRTVGLFKFTKEETFNDPLYGKYTETVADAPKILKGIIGNIIKHKGNFRPSKGPFFYRLRKKAKK